MKAASSDARRCLMAPRQEEDTMAEQASPSDIAGLNSRQCHSAS
jgi:hypothetical protein